MYYTDFKSILCMCLTCTVFLIFSTMVLQNSEKRLLKQWAEDTKQELSLANKELTAVSLSGHDML